MKKVLIFSALFLLASVSLSAQVVKGAGLWYFNNLPNVTPSVATGTEVAYSINNKALFKWNRTTSAWVAVVQDSSITNELQNLVLSGDTLSLTLSDSIVLMAQYRNHVWQITSLSDTTSITAEIEGDIAYTSTGDTIAFRGASAWLPFTGGGGGGTFNSFNIAGDTGSSIVTDGQTVTVAGGYGINTAEAGGTVTATVDTTQLKAQYLPKTLTSATEVNTAGQNLYFRDAGGFPYWFMNNSLFSAASGATTFINIGSTSNTVEINSASRTFIQSLGNSEVQAAAELRLDADSLVLDGVYPVGVSGDSVLVRDGTTGRVNLRAQSDIGGGGFTSFTLAGTSGTPQTITGGNTATIAAGTGITTTAGATDQVTVALANTAVTPGSYGSATQVPGYTVDAQGRLTAASNTSIQIAQSQVTGLADSLSGAPSGTGTNLRIPVWTGSATLGNSTLLQSAAGLTLDANLAFRQTGGTTASRPTGAAGMQYWNTSNGWLDIHNGTAWFNPARSSTTNGLFTAGSVLFGNSDGTVTQDNASFFYNSTSKNLGIGTASPANRLSIIAPTNTEDGTIILSMRRPNTGEICRFSDQAAFIIGNGVGFYPTGDFGANISRAAGGIFVGNFISGAASVVGNAFVTLGRSNNSSTNPTSGSGGQHIVSIRNLFNPTSGAVDLHNLSFSNNINQTGTSSGNIYGIDYNPTVTSILGTHYGLVIRPQTLNGIGTATPDRLLHSELSGSATNTVGLPLRLTHITTGTATTGFGTGMEFEAENASGTNRVIGQTEAVYTTATNAAEVSDLVFRTMRAGTLTESGRFLGAGGLTVSTTGSGLSGVTATSSTLYGVSATSTAGTAAYYGVTENATTNTLLLSQYLARSTTGTAANGIGQQMTFATETTIGTPFEANSIKSLWTDATHATRTSQLIFTGVSSGSSGDVLTIEGNGQLKANTYGVGTHTGTATRSLQVTSAGAVIEKALPAYGEASIFGSQTLAFTGGSTTYDTLSGYTLGEASGFSLVGGALKYTGTETIKVQVTVSMSLTFAEAGQVFGGIRQNTTNVTKSRAQQKIDTAGDVNNLAMTCILTLATNDLIRIELAPSAHTGDDNITVSNCNFNITEI